MNDHLCIVLVILVFSTSLNHGEKIKSNERRAYGLLSHPRIGRHMAMASFARPEGSAGMVNYPRVGRSGSFGSMASVDRNAREFDLDSRIDMDRDFDAGISDDFDYQGHHPMDYEESRKLFEAVRNDGTWPGASQGFPVQDKERQRMNRCNQPIDRPWAVLFATKDLASLEQQPGRNFVPRLVGEVDHEIPANSVNS